MSITAYKGSGCVNPKFAVAKDAQFVEVFCLIFSILDIKNTEGEANGGKDRGKKAYRQARCGE